MKFSKWKKSKLWLAIVLPILTIVLSACVTGHSEEEMTAFEEAQAIGSVTVGFANEQPYAYMNEDLELTGISVDIAREILGNLGIDEVSGVLTEFGILIPGLQAKRFDLVTAGMFITPSRAAADGVQFANPEFTIGEAIAVDEGNPKGLHSYEDIREHADATIAAVAGAIEYDYLIEVGVPEDRIITVPDNASALSALQADRVDAITATEPALRSMLDQADDPTIEVVDEFEQPVIDEEEVSDYGATVFREEDEDFYNAWNEELRKLEESGELLEIYEEYGFTENNLPGGISAEEAIE